MVRDKNPLPLGLIDTFLDIIGVLKEPEGFNKSPDIFAGQSEVEYQHISEREICTSPDRLTKTFVIIDPLKLISSFCFDGSDSKILFNSDGRRMSEIALLVRSTENVRKVRRTPVNGEYF